MNKKIEKTMKAWKYILNTVFIIFTSISEIFLLYIIFRVNYDVYNEVGLSMVFLIFLFINFLFSIPLIILLLLISLYYHENLYLKIEHHFIKSSDNINIEFFDELSEFADNDDNIEYIEDILNLLIFNIDKIVDIHIDKDDFLTTIEMKNTK